MSKTPQIKIKEETKRKLDVLRKAGVTLTYDQAIEILFQAQHLLSLLGKEERDDRITFSVHSSLDNR